MADGRFSVPFLLVLLLLLAVTPVRADDGERWRAFTPATEGEGMADDHVTSLVIDGGTLWVGSARGLSRYDGGVWNAFHPGAPGDDWGNNVRALLLDAEGYLWIGTSAGVSVLPPDEPWEARRQLPGDIVDVQSLGPASGSGVWVGWRRGAVFRSSAAAEGAGERREVDLGWPVEAIWDEGARDGGTVGDLPSVWFGTRGGGLVELHSDGQTRAFTETHGLPSALVHAVWGDPSGTLWVGTSAGACRLSRTDVDVSCRRIEALGDLVVTGFTPGPEDSLWVTTQEGVYGFRGDTLLETIYPSREVGLESDTVLALAQDTEGQLWLGTPDGLARRAVRVWTALLPAGDQPCQEDVHAIAEDPSGKLWVGTECGLRWWDPSGAWDSAPELADAAVRCLWVEPDGGLWLCLSRGIARVSSDGQLVDDPAIQGEPANLEVFDLRRGPDGALWLGTEGGVWRWDGAEWRAYQYDTPAGGPVNNRVYALAPEGQLGLWFGTEGGVSRFDGTAWTGRDEAGCPGEMPVEALALDPQGRLWVGTEAGLALCDGGEARRWTVHDGLAADRVVALALDTSGGPSALATLWVGGADGLSRVAVHLEGMPAVAFPGTSLPHEHVRALHVTQDGRVLIGTPQGLWTYARSPLGPQVRLRHYVAGNLDHDSFRQPDQTLLLAHDEAADFRAVGGDLRTPHDALVYRYAIESDGQTLGGSSLQQGLNAVAPISDVLRPGDQITLTVWAYDRDFNESTTPAQLLVSKAPEPLINQPWFLGLMAVLLVGGSAGGTYVGYRSWRARRLYPYRDLELTVSPGEEAGAYAVQLVADRGPALSPYPCTIDLAELQVPLQRVAREQTDGVLLRFLGQRLYDALFTPEATDHLRRHLGLGRRGVGVRLRLRFRNAPELAGLPWEFLHGGEGLGFLAVQRNVTVVRDLSPEEPEEILKTERPLKVLVAWATPTRDLTPIEANEQVDAIQEAFAAVPGTKRPVVDVLEHVQPPEFVAAVQQGYDLIHFIGHGEVRDGSGVLFFEDPYGASYTMSQADLVTQLTRVPFSSDQTPERGALKAPKLVVLNACRTADPGDAQGLAGLAAALVNLSGIPAVVGMGYKVPTDLATSFSIAFYRMLVRHGQVDYAVAEGRKAMVDDIEAGLRDWGVPRLYVRAPEGVIFEVI